MKRKLLNAALIGALALLVGAGWTAPTDTSRPNWEFLPNMVHSPAYASFSANPVFADGKSLQAPPEGTIARGELPLHYGASAEDAVRAGEELHPPATSTNAAAIERGRALFGVFCQPCHGANAAGNGEVVKRGFPAPPSLLSGNAVQYKDGRLFHVLTYGQKNMPSYASQISPDDRWKIAAYLRELQARAGAGKP